METEYRRDPKLKRAFIPIEFTKEQLTEYIKCSEDCIYFLKNYYYIFSEAHGKQLIDFKERPYQEEMIRKIDENKFVIAMLARRMGKTAIIVGYMLWYSLFHSHKTLHILSFKGDSANSILARLKKSYREIPLWMQQGILKWGVKSIELENGTEISAYSTSSDSVRGEPGHIIYMDELAFVPSRIANDLYTAIEPIIGGNPDAKLIITSTPNGYNFFRKLWVGAVEKTNLFIPLLYKWDALKRPEGWREERIKASSLEKFRQEQECEFLGGENSLISGTFLEELPIKQPIFTKENDNLDIYELPETGHRYVIVCDVSEGIGQDYSAFSVIDVTKKPFKQIAKYKCNTISVVEYPNIIFSTAKQYNNAYVLIELNDIGDQVANSLYHDLNYENIFFTRSAGPKGQLLTFIYNNKAKPGVKTSVAVKRQGCANLKYLIENKELDIFDLDTQAELSNFVKTGNSFAAKQGETDDIVMTLVLFGWLSKQGKFEELTKLKLKQFNIETKENIEQIIIPEDKDIIEDNDEIWEEVNFNQSLL